LERLCVGAGIGAGFGAGAATGGGTEAAVGGGGESSLAFLDDFFLNSGNPFIVSSS